MRVLVVQFSLEADLGLLLLHVRMMSVLMMSRMPVLMMARRMMR